MQTIFDILLLSISSVFLFSSIKKIFEYKSKSVADYIICLLFAFNCVPILCDLIFGVPNYSIYPWFYYFDLALNNIYVNIFYDLYLIVVFVVLKAYLLQQSKKNVENYTYDFEKKIINKKILILGIFLPVIAILLSGNVENYLIYGGFGVRNLEGFWTSLIVFIEQISLMSFMSWYFRFSKKPKSIWFIIFYSFVLSWIDGKRYIVVTILLLLLFFYLNSGYDKKRKLPLKLISVILIFGFSIFYYLYALAFKPIGGETFDLIYLSTRIDFGRDDVVKFVLYRELIENNPILEYRGESILSLLTIFIPRFIWEDKPYPHYRYLTAELFGTDIFNIPAGMTPSILEMMIANFGIILGVVILCIFIVAICNMADSNTSVPIRAMYLLLITIFLTQGVDAGLFFLIGIPLGKIFSKIKVKTKV